jgi:ABC-type transport system substrate-binding protein
VGYSNPDVDKLIETGRNGPDCSQAARAKGYQEMNKILNEDVPYMFGFAQNRILATAANVRGIETGSFSPNADWNIEKWWIKK